MPYILDETEEAAVTSLHARLTNRDGDKTLQQERVVSLSDIRALFDALIVKFPSMEHCLSENADIGHCKDFQNGVVKIIDGGASDLTDREKQALKSFEISEVLDPKEDIIFAECVLRAKKMKMVSNGYERLDWLQGTSNQCERLFSRAKLTLGHLRQGLSPIHLEALLFLFLIRLHWVAQLVSRVVNRTNNPKQLFQEVKLLQLFIFHTKLGKLLIDERGNRE